MVRRRYSSSRRSRSFGRRRYGRYSRRRSGRTFRGRRSRRRGYRAGGSRLEVKYISTCGGRNNEAVTDDTVEVSGDTFIFDSSTDNRNSCALWNVNLPKAEVVGDSLTASNFPVLASCYTKRCWLLTGVTQGFRGWQRIGLTVQPRSLIVRGVINAPGSRYQQDSSMNIPGTVDSAHNFVRATYRIVIFRNMEPGGIAPGSASPGDLSIGWQSLFAAKTGLPAPIISGADLVARARTYMATAGDEFHSVTDFMKTTNGGRFQVVSDTVHTVDGDDPQKNFSLSIPIRGKNLRFGGPEKGNIRAGHYYITACCTTAGAVGGTNEVISGPTKVIAAEGNFWEIPAVLSFNPSISFQARLAYTDG